MGIQNLFVGLPNLVSGLIILLIGLILGKITGWLILKIGKLMGIEHFSSGTNKLLHKIGYFKSSINFMSDVAKWAVYLYFIGISTEILLGKQVLSNMFVSFTAFLPKVVLTVIIFVIGLILADLLGNIAGRLTMLLRISSKEKNTLSVILSVTTKAIVVLGTIAISVDILGIYSNVFTIVFAVSLIALFVFVLVGMKDIALNLFAGIYLHTLSNFRKGTVIEINGIKGTIKEIGLIHTVLNTSKGEFTIPNYKFMENNFLVR
jgi:hypothetical protein